ncbi:MAG: hypothetical protein LBG97_08260 [Coriobacteriales bacterium]|jgi:hypothetical protein|nr:hypothetical protein [Coriobacteriales bacterium]
MSKVKHYLIIIISFIICLFGAAADVVFITSLVDNMKIFEGNKLYVQEAVGEWGLAAIVTLVALFIMFSAGRMWAFTLKQPLRNRIRILALILLWASLGISLAAARLIIAAKAGLNSGMIFEAVILLLLFLTAGLSIFILAQNFVNEQEKQDVFKQYAADEIGKCLEKCALIEHEQSMFISQLSEANRLKRNSIDRIITGAVINIFRTRKGIIVSEDEIPYRYMS